jgi:uncharacterized membrane protein
VVYDGKMWIIGGYDSSGHKNDVWYSTDGVNWIQATASAGWSPRYSHTSVVYDGKMWIIGGFASSGYSLKNDVWYSTDGVNWIQATASAGWSPRYYYTSVVYDGKMWIIGGYNSSGYSLKNDVWYSTDGTNWTRATTSAGWSPRDGHTSVVYDGKMWIIGGFASSGYKNDVWYSTDGVNWIQATASAGWSPRYSHTSVVYDNKMWIVGGFDSSYNLKNDVWYSTDSVDWTQTTAAPPHSTTLSISPSSFVLQSGQSITLTATLMGGDNNPLAGKTIDWDAILWHDNDNVVTLPLYLGRTTTNSFGQASITYTTDTGVTKMSVRITASFGGDNQYQSSSGYSYGTITAENIVVPTVLIISPSSFTIPPSSSTILTATLKDNANNPLAGKVISWSASSGTISPISGTTNSYGQISVTYTAPDIVAQVIEPPVTVSITASFAGDNQYKSSRGYSYGTITVARRSTTLGIVPSSFVIQSGQSMTLTVVLFSYGENTLSMAPVGGGTITLGASRGSVNPTIGVTDNIGRVTITYTAPITAVDILDNIWATFAGDNQYQASNGYSYGTITAENVVPILTYLSISPSSFTLSPGGTKTITAMLKDNANNPLAGKTITWTKTTGSLSSTSGTTNSSGQVSVTYTAPSYETTVTVTASFAGDNQYGTSNGNSSGTIVKASTILIITPSTFTLQPGNSTTLTVTLTSNGSPLVGKTLTWSAALGEIVPSVGSTNSSGQVIATYTAPSYENSVVITATFAGDNIYQASSGSSSGTIESSPPLQALIKIEPDTLQIGGEGNWVTCYIEISTDNVSRIDVSSILLEGRIQVDPTAPTEIGDHDNNGAPDLMVKFNRQSVENIVAPGIVSLTVTGNVGESRFFGTDKIDVINPGPGALVSAKSVSSGAPEVKEEVYNLDLNIATQAGDNKVTVSVSSEISTGTTIVINIDNTVVPISSLGDLKVLVDNREIRLADDYADILDTTDENEPEYLILFGAEWIQVLVSVPHFSTHTITVGNAAAMAPPQPPEEVIISPAGGISLPVVLAIVVVAVMLIISAAWISHQHALGEATSDLLEYGLHSMSIQEADIFRVIKEQKKFTIPELMRQTGASKTVAWRTVQKLIKKGLVEPTDKVKAPATGRGKPSTVYKYVGD